MDKPIVSVIVPIYNAKRYLVECLDCILAQSFSDIEVLLVDDGSTDGSGAIADNYARQDGRITVYHNANTGVSNSRNFGIFHAAGEWLTFVDSDDFLAESYLEDLLEMAGPETDFCYCNFDMITEKGRYLYETFRPGKDNGDTLRNLFLSGWMFSIGILFRKSFLEGNHLFFPAHINYTEDVWFTARAIYFSKHISKTERPLYHYNRFNTGSITHNAHNERAESVRLASMEETIGFLQQHNVFEKCKDACYWRVLVWKSWLIYHPDKYPEFNMVIPEANRYILSNPFLSARMQTLLWMIAHHIYLLPSILVRLFQGRIRSRQN